MKYHEALKCDHSNLAVPFFCGAVSFAVPFIVHSTVRLFKSKASGTTYLSLSLAVNSRGPSSVVMLYLCKKY